MDVYPWIIEAAGSLWEIFFAYLNDQLVDLNQVDLFNFLVAGQFSDNAAVSGADDQHLFDIGMNCHWNVGNHFVIDKLILLGQHHVAVEGEESSKFRRFKDIDALKLTFSAVKLTVHTNGEFYIRCLQFRKPKFHLVLNSFQNIQAQNIGIFRSGH